MKKDEIVTHVSVILSSTPSFTPSISSSHSLPSFMTSYEKEPKFPPNLFETKTAVKERFNVLEPVKSEPIKAEIPRSPIETKDISEKEEEEKEASSKRSDIVEEETVEKVKKPLPNEPWIDKARKKPPPQPDNEPSVENKDEVPIPAKGYNLYFLNQVDDPNKSDNGLEIKEDDAKQMKEIEELALINAPESLTSETSIPGENEDTDIPPATKRYNLDFPDKVDDPNFDVSEERISEVKDSAPESEQHKAQFVSSDNESTKVFVLKEQEVFLNPLVTTSPDSVPSTYSTLLKSTQEKLNQELDNVSEDHEKHHSPATLIKCSDCEQTFSLEANFKMHSITNHGQTEDAGAILEEDISIIYCDKCDFSTKNGDSLRLHISKSH